MTLLLLAVTTGLAVLLTIAATNCRAFPRLRPASAARPQPNVSVLIPARNEAAVLADTLHRLATQDYANLEILVLDDRSEDSTLQIARQLAAQFPHIRVLQGTPLPPGWTGKNWACAQLATAATADLLLFTDADVRWHPGAVHSVVATLQTLDADLLTVWPTQLTHSWGERLTVPLMAMAVLGYLPVRLAHDFFHPLAAAANGQCMAFRRPAYTAIGGHAAVQAAIVEDIQLAEHIKAAGLKLRMADGAGLVACRMYAGSQAAFDGYTKNILAGHHNRLSLLALSTLFHGSLFLFPWIWLLAGAPWPLPGWPGWPLALILAGVTLRGVTAAATRQRVADAITLPLSVLLFTAIAARALWWKARYGGVLWKGRVLHVS